MRERGRTERAIRLVLMGKIIITLLAILFFSFVLGGIFVCENARGTVDLFEFRCVNLSNLDFCRAPSGVILEYVEPFSKEVLGLNFSEINNTKGEIE